MKIVERQKKYRFLKALASLLKLLAMALILYLIFLPIYPEFKYNLKSFNNNYLKENDINKNSNEEPSILIDKLVIKKIGVDIPIIATDSEGYGLSNGAWLMPNGSTPDLGGNTIITGHRFRYLPPNNLTFYLFHKLEVGDVFFVIWQENYYWYKIKEIKIVEPSDASVYDKSERAILTMYTCHPIYSTAKRLVIISDLVFIGDYNDEAIGQDEVFEYNE